MNTRGCAAGSVLPVLEVRNGANLALLHIFKICSLYWTAREIYHCRNVVMVLWTAPS